MENLSGKTALVTGSTDGVGRLVARELGQAGARVLVHGRDAERAARVVAEIEAAGGAATGRATVPPGDRIPPACARAAGHDSDTACGSRPARHPRPADRPGHCAETTRGAGAIRYPAPASDRQPERTGPDPSAFLCDSTPAASTRTDPAAVLAIASTPASTRPIVVAGAIATATA